MHLSFSLVDLQVILINYPCTAQCISQTESILYRFAGKLKLELDLVPSLRVQFMLHDRADLASRVRSQLLADSLVHAKSVRCVSVNINAEVATWNIN